LIAKEKHAKAFSALHGVEPNPKEYVTDNTTTSPTPFRSYLRHILLLAVLLAFWLIVDGYSSIMHENLIHGLFSDDPIMLDIMWDFIGYLVSIPLILFLTRRRLMCFALLTVTSLLLITIALPSKESFVLQLILNVCHASCNPLLVVLSLHLLELLPATARSTAYGSVQSISYISIYYIVDSFCECWSTTVLGITHTHDILACSLYR
jgi:hypothetical protein